MATNDKHIKLSQLQMLAQRVKKEMLKSGVDVPTKVSELVNDSGFQTEDDVLGLIDDADHMKRKIVDSIDDIDLTASDADKYIYMVKHVEEGESEDDPPIEYYEEYMVVGGKVDKIGDTRVDMTGYVKYTDAATDEEITEMINGIFGEPSDGE